MSVSQSQTILRNIEEAIDSRNFGRMNEIGNDIIVLAKDNVSWLEAVIIIVGYLTKSHGHLWDAVNLSKQAAIMAPEQTSIQQLAINALITSIKSFPKVEERVKAAHTVVVTTPKTSIVLHISIDLMLDEVTGLPSSEERRRYTHIALYYAPEQSDVKKKASTMLRHEEELARKVANSNKPKPPSQEIAAEMMLEMLNKHKDDLEDILTAHRDTPPKDK